MVMALDTKLESIVELHDATDRKDASKRGFWKNSKGIVRISDTEIFRFEVRWFCEVTASKMGFGKETTQSRNKITRPARNIKHSFPIEGISCFE